VAGREPQRRGHHTAAARLERFIFLLGGGDDGDGGELFGPHRHNANSTAFPPRGKPHSETAASAGASSAPSGNDVLGCAAVDVYGLLHGTEVAFNCRAQVDLRQPGKPVSQVRAPCIQKSAVLSTALRARLVADATR
jgi:hypothetical protein